MGEIVPGEAKLGYLGTRIVRAEESALRTLGQQTEEWCRECFTNEFWIVLCSMNTL